MIRKIKSFLGKLKFGLIIFVSKLNYSFIYKKNKYKILNDEDVITKIIKEGKSLSRFGDGEFKWMLGVKQLSFQENNKDMQEKLKKIIREKNSKLIIGIPRALNSLNGLNKNAKKEWKLFIFFYYKLIKKYLNEEKVYADTNITRFYIDYLDKSKCQYKIKNIKKIWENRDVVIIEGEKTKLGVGNDLFENAKSVKRIIAPSKNAYQAYDKIFNIAQKQTKDKIFLLSLGPTATILASDLSKRGYQAIDIGHVDIEYEWLLMKAKEKVPIKGKYVNEAKEKGDLSSIYIYDKYYKDSIIKIIK